jgi:transposase
MMDAAAVFVGIDVGKAYLDVAVRPTGTHERLPNDEAGVARLADRLRAARPALVVLEATGGLEVPLTAALATVGLAVAVVNPRQVRDFAKAVGQWAKTDALDAHLLARFAEVVRPEPRPLPDADAQALAALLTRRRQVIAMLVAEQQRLATTVAPFHSPAQVDGCGRSATSWTATCATGSAGARSGARTTTCCRACRASGRCSRRP